MEKELVENLDATRVFAFDNPRRIIFGVGATRNVGQEAGKLGRTALIVTDDSVEKAGLIGRVVEHLEKDKISSEIFRRDAKREPSFESMNEAAEFIRQHHFEMIIGVGGGSVLDTSKIMAMAATNPGQIDAYMDLQSPSEIQKDRLPLILMPTTSGTGSEATPFAVAIDEKTALKCWAYSPKLLSNVSIIDPILTLSCPPKVTANSGMDALSQSIESVLAGGFSPLSEMIGLKAIRLISGSLSRSYHHGESLEARSDMSLGALMGGWVLGFPWSGGGILGHGIAETVGPKLGIPHGFACALALPYMMEFNLPAARDKLALIASAMGEDIRDLTRSEAATLAIQAVLELMEDIDLPSSLKQVTSTIDAPALAELVFKRRAFYATNPRKLTQENCLHVVEKMWEGRLSVNDHP
jgi:alcohol dehydrogenase